MNRIGVAVPTLNAAVTLPWTLLSLRQQVGIVVDTVVVDSGSTDGTVELCASAGTRSVYEPPGNMYRAVNAGLRSLDAPWLTYLNGDDAAYTDAYRTLVETGERTGADIVYGDCDYVDWHGRFLYAVRAAPPKHALSMYRRGLMPFSQPCAVFRRTLFERLGGFDEGYRSAADMDFFARAVSGGARLERQAGFPVVAFRLHQGQITARLEAVGREEISRLVGALSAPPHLWDGLVAWRWRVANALHYLGRRIRTGQWRGRPPIVSPGTGEDRS